MDKNRKILIAVLAMLALSSVVAILDISLRMPVNTQKAPTVSMRPSGPGVAVVHLQGAIEMQSQGAFGMVSGSTATLQRLEEVAKDSNIKAIVLRINSPGGTVAASEELFQKVWRIRRQNNIPIVASLGEVAASGGYYVAAACNHIMANHGTVTGSIGVILVSPNLKDLFKRFGIDMNVIKSGSFKDVLASHRDLTADEKAFLQEMVDSSYSKFLRDVALGRGMNQSDIEPWADGRVFNGEKALELKLVDSLGTFDDALLKAKELAGLDEDAPVYSTSSQPWKMFLKQLEQRITVGSFLNRFLENSETLQMEYRWSR